MSYWNLFILPRLLLAYPILRDLAAIVSGSAALTRCPGGIGSPSFLVHFEPQCSGFVV